MFSFKKFRNSNKKEFNTIKFMALSIFQETISLLNHLSEVVSGVAVFLELTSGISKFRRQRPHKSMFLLQYITDQ